ncbi:hypothetical protein OPV22_033133 [Ensete ventricosum]|uniref:BHLH domain-containing protein n=1 Tax=Ensete ventricosum TaxID=4639 RepID=A0AAV8PXD4_ENSVE|nr:hypothetical protein OPV22_033133 [Ensete ventricosum]
MAEEFRAGTCSGGSWWTASELVEAKARSFDESAGSACGSSITFQETHKIQRPDGGLSSSSMTWTQALLNGAMLREDLDSRPTGGESSTSNPYGGDMSQNLLLQQQHHLSDVGGGGYQITPASYASSSMMLQDLLESETKQQQFIYDGRVRNQYQSPMSADGGSSDELWQPSWLSHLLKSSLSNSTPLWNVSASEMRPVFSSPTPSKYVMQPSEPKIVCGSTLTAKMESSGGDRDSCSSSTKITGSEAATKKPRIETHSPLPTFKVRKEKLGDRITALQQLVSPFGKTDTASVLQEAIEYIKFLHDQVGVLSSPYLKNEQLMKPNQISEESKDCDEPKQDLRSRGLCLVPVTSTYPVASETTTDFWHPTLGGTFR